MQVTLFDGYPDYIGRRFAFAGKGVGPSSYSQTTKDVVVLPTFQNYIDAIVASNTVSGTYQLRAKPSVASVRATWVFTWIVTATGLEVANGVNLSAETVIVHGFGGRY
jgi:hypothetical protein